MMKDLSISLLKTFITVVQTHNQTLAAQVLNKSPSAISLQLSRLEEVLDTSIIERGRYGVRLTAAGKLLEDDARKLIQLYDEIVGKYQHGTINGTVRFGMHDQYATSELIPILKAFVLSYPEVDLEVYSDHRPNQMEKMVRDGQLDLALIDWSVESAEGVRLACDELVWVCSKVHQINKQLPLPIAVFPEGSYHRDCVISKLENKRIDFRIAFCSPSYESIISAVRAGLCVGILPRKAVETEMVKIGYGLPSLPKTYTTMFISDQANEATIRLSNLIKHSNGIHS